MTDPRLIARIELLKLTSTELWDKVIEKHGMRKANILVNEESFKIVKRQLSLDTTLKIQREASLRVLAGQWYKEEVTIKEGLI